MSHKSTLLSPSVNTAQPVKKPSVSAVGYGLQKPSDITVFRLLPTVGIHQVLSLLQRVMHLKQCPDFETEMIRSAEYGPSFIPVRFRIEPHNAQQKEQGCQALKPILSPMPEPFLQAGYQRMRLGCSGSALSATAEKDRMQLYVDTLSQYPAAVACYVLTHPFKWFPTLGEVTQMCQEENKYLTLIQAHFFNPVS